MGTSLSVADNQALQGHHHVNEDVRRCVEHQEWLERVVSRTVLWGVFGTGVLVLLARYSWQVTGGVLIGGAVVLFIAKLAVALAHALVLEPSRNLRFRLAAKKAEFQARADGGTNVLALHLVHQRTRRLCRDGSR